MLGSLKPAWAWPKASRYWRPAHLKKDYIQVERKFKKRPGICAPTLSGEGDTCRRGAGLGTAQLWPGRNARDHTVGSSAHGGAGWEALGGRAAGVSADARADGLHKEEKLNYFFETKMSETPSLNTIIGHRSFAAQRTSRAYRPRVSYSHCPAATGAAARDASEASGRAALSPLLRWRLTLKEGGTETHVLNLRPVRKTYSSEHAPFGRQGGRGPREGSRGRQCCRAACSRPGRGGWNLPTGPLRSDRNSRALPSEVLSDTGLLSLKANWQMLTEAK